MLWWREMAKKFYSTRPESIASGGHNGTTASRTAATASVLAISDALPSALRNSRVTSGGAKPAAPAQFHGCLLGAQLSCGCPIVLQLAQFVLGQDKFF